MEPLIEFDSQSQSPNGTWTLILQDTPNDSFSNGSLQFYSATLCINEPCPAITSLIIGDVDASDARAAVDASVLLEALVGVNPSDAIHVSAAGDVNADSIIDNRDSILILAIVAGRILPPPNLNSITATALATGAVINITGSVDPTRANRTVNLRNTANNATTFTTADTQGSFGSLAPVTLPGVAGNTIVADIDGSPARAAILVQQGGGEGQLCWPYPITTLTFPEKEHKMTRGRWGIMMAMLLVAVSGCATVQPQTAPTATGTLDKLTATRKIALGYRESSVPFSSASAGTRRWATRWICVLTSWPTSSSRSPTSRSRGSR